MSEDYGLKSFNGMIFTLLGIMVVAVIAAALLFHLWRPKMGETNRSPQTTVQPSHGQQTQ